MVVRTFADYIAKKLRQFVGNYGKGIFGPFNKSEGSSGMQAKKAVHSNAKRLITITTNQPCYIRQTQSPNQFDVHRNHVTTSVSKFSFDTPNVTIL